MTDLCVNVHKTGLYILYMHIQCVSVGYFRNENVKDEKEKLRRINELNNLLLLCSIVQKYNYIKSNELHLLALL